MECEPHTRLSPRGCGGLVPSPVARRFSGVIETDHALDCCHLPSTVASTLLPEPDPELRLQHDGRSHPSLLQQVRRAGPASHLTGQTPTVSGVWIDRDQLHGQLTAVQSQSVSLVGHRAARDGSDFESIRIARGEPDARAAAADLAADGGVIDRIEHRASKKEVSELRAARILVEHLNQRGGDWQPPEMRAGSEDGVDCVARSRDGNMLVRVQVTTPERDAWSQVARGTQFDRDDPNVANAVEAMRTAVEHKIGFAGKDSIILALDATDSPRYALRGVADTFRAKYGTWTRTAGYAGVWVVGPVGDTVYRLDAELTCLEQ